MSQSNSKSNQAKHHTAEFKAKVVLEVLGGPKSFSQACREYEISEQSLSEPLFRKCRHHFRQGW